MIPDNLPLLEVGTGLNPGTLRLVVATIYAVMGAGGLLAGLLHVTAGIFGLWFRRRTLGVAALLVGLASVTTVYCLPTSIGLAI